MKSTIVIPTWQRSQQLSRILDSLSLQVSADYEVVVVCDGQDPQTQALSESYSAKFPLKWIFFTANQGLTSARNRGAQAAEGEIVLFLDDDMTVPSDWIARHERHHEEKETGGAIAVVGSITHVYSRPPHSRAERFLREGRNRNEAACYKLVQGKHQGAAADSAGRCIWLGVNCSIRRAVFLSSGGFDESLPDVNEELEMGYRLYAAGVRFVYEPFAVVYHHDDKDLLAYYRRSWSISGHVDLYRVAQKRQRCNQTQGLTSLCSRDWLIKAKARFIWEHPDLARKIAKGSLWCAEASGSKRFFGLWRGMSISTEYWEAIRGTGQTRDSLQELQGAPVPVMAFHSISEPWDRKDAEYALSPLRFRRVLEFLRLLRLRSLTPQEAFSGAAPERGVVLTFDDGYEDFYYEVFPHIELFGLKPVVFLPLEFVGKWSTWDAAFGYRARKLLSSEQIRELHRHGVRFGSHSISHPRLTSLADAELRCEVEDSKARLEDLLGSEITSFAYPYGAFDQRVRSAVGQAGYRFAFTTRTGLNFWEDLLTLKRLEVSERVSISELALMLYAGVSLQQNVLRPLREKVQRQIRRRGKWLLQAAGAARLPRA